MIANRFSLSASIFAATLSLAACGSETPDTAPAAPEASVKETAEAETPQVATASLKTADGKDVGTVTATQRDDGIFVAVTAMGMSAGDHGIHVHTTGKCEGPKFESAGGHWNPTGAKHGLSNPEGSHEGDMPNLTIATDGTGKMDYAIAGGKIADMLDTDGAALVVHTKADDQATDPSGDSGDRVACGLFTAG